MSGAAGRFQTGERLLLDSVALVYLLERNPRFGQLAHSVMTRVVNEEVKAIISSIVFAELLVFPYKKADVAAAQTMRAFVQRLAGESLHDVTAEIADRAAVLRAKYNLRTPDAIHVATGLMGQANWIVTNDRRLRRVEAEGIRVWLFEEHLAG